MSKVLVTGGSGFVGGHVILQLLQEGHQVHTTVRNLKREPEVRSSLKAAGANDDTLSFFSADLGSDAGWAEAVRGCEYVLHVASPFPGEAPKDENELIIPARDGTLRVLRASRDAAVKRVVMTSSFAAIGYGHPPQGKPFDETDWTDPKSEDVPAYHKSKTIAERAAWDFVTEERSHLELSVINPVGIFGPVLGRDLSSSVGIIKAMMTGAIPACPKVYFGVVDVRDVADIHIRAMTHPQAKGERFLASAGDCTSMFGIAQALRKGMGTAAAKVPTRELPNWLVRLTALVKPSARGVLPELGKVKHISNEKAKRLLSWSPRSNEEAVVATAESLIRLRILNGTAR